MINEVKLLTVLELRSLYGLNKFRYNKNKKERNRYCLLMAVWAFLVVWAVLYIGALVYGFSAIGMSELVPTYLVMIASLLVFFFGIFKAGHVIFAKKGYDFLCSLPIRSHAVVIARFLTMYAEDLVLALVVMLPGAVVYGYYVKPGLGFYFSLLASTFFVPMLPLTLATVVGTLITAVSSKMKWKTMVQTILSVSFIIVVLLWSMLGSNQLPEEFSPEMLKEMTDTFSGMIRSVYPPAVWLGDGAVAGPLVAIICAGLTAAADIYVSQWIDLVKAGICVLLSVVTAILYRKNNKGSAAKRYDWRKIT